MSETFICVCPSLGPPPHRSQRKKFKGKAQTLILAPDFGRAFPQGGANLRNGGQTLRNIHNGKPATRARSSPQPGNSGSSATPPCRSNSTLLPITTIPACSIWAVSHSASRALNASSAPVSCTSITTLAIRAGPCGRMCRRWVKSTIRLLGNRFPLPAFNGLGIAEGGIFSTKLQ